MPAIMSRHIRLLLLLIVLLAVPHAVQAETVRSNPVDTEATTTDLLSETTVVAPGETTWVALRMRLREGWHTYWRNSGDSGEPARLTWELPQGVTAGEIVWPAPGRMPYGPLINYGFKNEVWFLLPVAIPAEWPTGQPVPLRLQAEWLVCADICIPESGALAMDLPTGPATQADAALAEGFATARAKWPKPSPWGATVQVTPERIGLRVEAPDLDPTRIEDAYFFVGRTGAVEPAAPQTRSVDPSGMTLELAPGRTAAAGPMDGVLVLTERLESGPVSHAFELQPVAGVVPAAIAGTADLGLSSALLLALAGGLLLNLMPCVFPVLAMKAVALTRHSGGSDRDRRLNGLAYGLGVVVSFAAIAALLLGFRATGQAVGWGFQLQNPVVVLVLAWLLFTVGLSLSGLVTVGGAWMGRGGALAGRSGQIGAFGTGALAVLVATPCTAPLMAAALGYALVQSAPTALFIFVVLGIGMALPMVLVSLFPGLGRRLPQPGAWMERLKQALAFPMYASAAWLVWVLSLQAGSDGVAAALGGMVLIAAAAWCWRLRTSVGATGRRLAAGLAMVLMLGAAGLASVPRSGSPLPVVGGAVADDDASEPYNEPTLARLRAEGRPVFLNLTAAWCITCQVNERLALSGQAFLDALSRNDVAYLKGDWTNRDAAITALLERFGRSGVPLYVLFPSDGGPPEILPQILTEATVLDALDNRS